MRLLITLLLLIINYSAFAQIGPFNHEIKNINIKDLSSNKLMKIEDDTFAGDKAIKVLEPYMGYNQEGKVSYFYNYTTGEIELYLKNEISSLVIYDYEITREICNIYFIIDSKIKLHASYNKSDGKTIDIVSYQKDRRSGEWVKVITEE
ncbi:MULTISPECIES: hypothetical protein [Flammeovirga]|uniref:Uncharacterized protein n=1 Tax=Flammeovirga agarivorans TaxID=2726742 RepID=A0A7X8SK31_9BACT|nr:MULTISPECIES: hypothetical protein [Flammeovirga]NLR91583.1 hypothetical protein [Flammeovirga agarivorans]